MKISDLDFFQYCLQNCDANIYFNQQYVKKDLIPKFDTRQYCKYYFIRLA
jgi:hypothetical protein